MFETVHIENLVLRDAILTHPSMAEGLDVVLTNVSPDTNTRMAVRALARWEGEGGQLPRVPRP